MSEKKFAGICEYLQLGSGQEPTTCCASASYRVTALRTVSCAPNSPRSQCLDVCAAHQMSLGQIYIFDGQPYSVGWCLSFEYLPTKERTRVINKQTTDASRTTDKLADVILDAKESWGISAFRAADRVREAFILIDRDSLPEVSDAAGGIIVDGVFFATDIDGIAYLRVARRQLAAAEYCAARSRAVEKDKRALQQAVEDVGGYIDSYQAEALIAAGWKREEVK